jgi:hypothetical protein
MTYDPQTAQGLQAEVERYEREDSLPPEAFEQYIRSESALESLLGDLAAQQEMNLDFAGTHATLNQVVDLNQTIQNRVDRELNRLGPIDDDFRRDLVGYREEAGKVILYAEGQMLVTDAARCQMSGDIETTINILEQARNRFAELAGSNGPAGQLGQLRVILTSANIEFCVALREFRCSRYDGARDACQRVRAVLAELLEETNAELSDSGGQPDTRLSDLQRGLSDQLTYAQAFLSLTSLFVQIKAGNYEKAVEYAADAVRLGEEWLKTNVSQGLPRIIQNLRRMELEQYHGWLGLAQAEYAVDQRRWDDCRRHIRQAQTHWNTAVDYLLRHQLLAAYSPTDIPNIDLLLQATLRRCHREESLYEEIERLREEKRQAGNINVHAWGGNAMTSSDSWSFQGPVTAGAIGPNAHSEAETIAGEYNTAPNLGAIAAELAQLAEAMKAGGGMTDDERHSIEQVALAEQAARGGNEGAMRGHLKAAGQWAATVAKQLALTAAEAAIRANIGR